LRGYLKKIQINAEKEDYKITFIDTLFVNSPSFTPDMPENYRQPEDLLSDESFLAWYFRSGKEGEGNWDLWIAGHPDRTLLVEQAVQLLQAVRQPEKGIDPQQLAAAESALFKRIGELPETRGGEMMEEGMEKGLEEGIGETNEEGDGKFRERRIGGSNRRWMVAAAVFLALAIGLIVSKIPGRQSEIKTAYGQLTRRQLPDGTEVTMNANSRIRFSPDWKDGIDREVWMDGEAFFHVSKTPLKSRFIVHIDHFDIIVTGTQFNVVNRHGTENVLLEEGSVILRTRDGKELHMKPGDFVAFRDAQLEKGPVQHDSLVAWKEQKLVFDKTPLRQLVRIINDQYGVNMRLDNESISDSTISAILPDNNLDVLLNALKATMDFDIIKEGDSSIVIKAHTGQN
jgi:ferric-dicitrate binding protein FerR (iron transport regulator)